MIDPGGAVTLGNALASLGWLVLIAGPRRWPALNAVPRLVLPLLFSVVYAAFALPSVFSGAGDFSSLDGIRTLFGSDAALAAGWLHYLAFDLFVGAWIAARSDEAGIARLVQAPILLATFLLGPLGLLLFHVTRGLMSASPFGKPPR